MCATAPAAEVGAAAAAVLWRARHTGGGYRLQRFLVITGTPVRYRTASGAAGINVNGSAASAGGHRGRRSARAIGLLPVGRSRL